MTSSTARNPAIYPGLNKKTPFSVGWHYKLVLNGKERDFRGTRLFSRLVEIPPELIRLVSVE